MCAARARGDRRRRGGVLDQLLVRAPRASTASRSRAASPSATRSRRCSSPRARRARAWCSSRPGEQCTYADVYEWQPTRRAAVHLPAVRGAGRQAPRAGRAARAGPRRRRGGVAAGHAAAAHDAVHDGGRVQPQHRHGVRGADEGRVARCASRRTAIPSGGRCAAADLEQSPMKPRWETFEVSESHAFPELQGRRVSDLARERGCSPLDVMCELAVAEDLETRFRAYIANDDVDAVGAPAHARAASRSASPTRARTSTSCATRRCPPTCSARGCASARSCRSSRRCAS